MKPYIRVLVDFPITSEQKAAIIEHYKPTRIRIGDATKQYPETEEETEYFDTTELDDEDDCCGDDDCEHNEPTPPSEPKERDEKVTEPDAKDKHGRSLALIAQFEEKFGKKPHHNAKDETILEALTSEA